jgi:hypothetical protein
MTDGNKPQPTHGDLVSVNGYGNRVFQVESYYDQRWFYPDETWTDRIYELFDMGNADYIEADATDLTLITDASQADEYLRANPAPIEPSNISELLQKYGVGGNEMSQPNQPEKKPTARELSSQEAAKRKQARKDRAKKVDELLDERNDVTELAKNFGDKAGEYGERVAEIDRELAELVAEGDGR